MSNDRPEILPSKHAWRDIDRAARPKRAAADRVADFLEIYGPYSEATAQEQAARCIQCPEPLCVDGCPLHSSIPEWLALTAEGQFLEAASLMQSTINLPGICSRMCPTERLCEGHCILDGKAEPVNIGAIENFLNEYAFAHGGVNVSTAAPNGFRVAVVGSGPSGLTCADELAQRGYAVTVYATRALPGGLLVNELPAFKIDKSIVQRRIGVLKEKGVAFQSEARIGKDLTLGELREGYDAVYVCLGAPMARPLNLPGENLTGVVQALPFIMQQAANPVADSSTIDVTAKRVVVIGGGDTAMDCLRTAIRCHASDVLCIYRRDEASMPCSDHEHDDALEEHARFLCQAVPVAVLGDENNRVTGLRLLRTELAEPDADGRPGFKPISGTEFEIPADWVILALGFDPLTFPHSTDFSTLATGDNGGLQVNDSHMTSVEGVFAGGRIVHGANMVVESVRDARRAAANIDSFLRPDPAD